MAFEDLIIKRLQKRKDEREKKAAATKPGAAKGPDSNGTISGGDGSKKQGNEAKAAAKELGRDEETVTGPVLGSDDEQFLERLTSPQTPPRPAQVRVAVAADHDAGGDLRDDNGGQPPLLPPRGFPQQQRARTPELVWDSETEEFIEQRDATEVDPSAMALVPFNRSTEMVVASGGSNPDTASDATEDEQVIEPEQRQQHPGDKKKRHLPHHLFSRMKRGREHKKSGETKKDGTPKSLDNDDDLKRMLDELDLATAGPNKKIFSLSADSAQLSRRFLLILKDLVNGVPTAADDLQALLSDRDGALSKHYEKLPKSMKKIVTQLPGRMQSTLAPEALAVAAEAAGVEKGAAAQAGMKGMAKKLFMPSGLTDMVTKPGAVITMLKAIVNALKLRWPALLGTSAMMSTALFLLLFVLWYCHKRGKEVRLDKERVEDSVDGADRVEELPDDPALPAPAPGAAAPFAATPAAAAPRRPSPVRAAMRGAKTNRV